MTKIKICGITKLEDALLACELGAWAVGFIFVKSSLRFIEFEKAGEITAQIPLGVEKVGVFVNSTIEEIEEAVKKTRITMVQLHGDETAEFCKELKQRTELPLIKALRVKDTGDLELISEFKGLVSAILLDTYSEKEFGGTGETFDWNIAVEAKKHYIPIILAGGLNSDNIAEANELVKPYALDVSSGVEISKGVKDYEKLRRLFGAGRIYE